MLVVPGPKTHTVQLNSQRSETGETVLRRGSVEGEGRAGEKGGDEVVPVMYKSLSEWQLAYDALLLSSKRVNLR